MTVESIFSNFDADDVVWGYVTENGRSCYRGINIDDLPGDFGDPNDDSPMQREIFCDILKKQGFDFTAIPHIEDATPAVQLLWKEIMGSENCMWFVEDDSDYYGYNPWDEIGITREEFERQVDSDIEKYGLQDVIVKYDDDTLYTCYGDLMSSFTGIISESLQ